MGVFNEYFLKLVLLAVRVDSCRRNSGLIGIGVRTCNLYKFVRAVTQSSL